MILVNTDCMIVEVKLLPVRDPNCYRFYMGYAVPGIDINPSLDVQLTKEQLIELSLLINSTIANS